MDLLATEIGCPAASADDTTLEMVVVVVVVAPMNGAGEFVFTGSNMDGLPFSNGR